MNKRMVLHVVGLVLLVEAGLLLLPAVIALCYMEKSGLWFLLCAGISALFGLGFKLLKPKFTGFYARDGFAATALSWLAMSAMGALPFFLSGQIPNYLDALFETVSGFTTTGASILPDVEALDHCMLFWRSFTHWVGGMGVLVFMLAVLPLTGGQNLHLMRAESPGPSVGKLVPRLRDSAIWLYGIYFGLSLLCFLMLWIGGMPVFDAACLTFGTAGTGGFGVLGSSFADYNLYCKIVDTVFMLLFGFNFNFFYLIIIKKLKDAFKMEEIRWYLAIYFFAVITILLSLLRAGMLFTDAQPIDAFFSVASIMTTTGFATVDFNVWPTYCRMLLVLIMFTGACAGSTGGGIKISRWIIYLKSLGRELNRLTHPRAVKSIRLEGKTIDDNVLHNTFVYLGVFICIYVASILIVATDGFDITTTFTSVAATINNIGPGLNQVGPVGNFGGFSYLSKIVLIFDMLAGRLEIYPLLIFFLPSSWKKQ